MTTTATGKSENSSLFSKITYTLCVVGFAETSTRFLRNLWDLKDVKDVLNKTQLISNLGGAAFYGATVHFPQLNTLGAAVFTGYAIQNAAHQNTYQPSKLVGLAGRTVLQHAQTMATPLIEKVREALPKVTNPHHPSWLGVAALGALSIARYLRG